MPCSIVPPVDRSLLKAELTPDKQLRTTNRGGNVIYVITGQDSPNVLREVGRLREEAFRSAGGGTGQSLDLDEFDICEHPYKQLIVWDPEDERILGGYRYQLGKEALVDANHQPQLATAELFHFTEVFVNDYLPYTIELGRSFVSRVYQSTQSSRKGIFALDNLWDGLGALVVMEPTCRYLFGKFTMYPTYDREARDMIHYFLGKHFPDPDALLQPIQPVAMGGDADRYKTLFCHDTFREDYETLKAEVRKRGTNIPPLVNAYMNLSSTMRLFGTAVNEPFGHVEETGMLITVDDILPEKRIRHIDSFAAEHPEFTALSNGRKYYNVENK